MRRARTRLLGATCLLASALAACGVQTTAPPAPRSSDQGAFQIPTAIPLNTPAADLATAAPPNAPTAAPPTAVRQAPQQPEAPQPTPLVEGVAPSLLELGPGDQIKLVTEIPIPRTDFGVRLAFSPAGNMLLHSGGGLTIQRYDLLRNQPASALTGFELMSPLTISISPDGLAVAADDGAQIRVWDYQTGQLTTALPLPPISALASAGFFRDQLYFTVDFSGNVLIWDPRSWGQITQFSYPGRIEAAVLFPDGSAIALQDRDQNRISVYDTDGNLRHSVSFEGSNAKLLSVSPNGDRFLLHTNYGSPSEGVRVISAETGDPQVVLDLLNFRQFAVSADWQLLAASGVDNELRLYSLPAGDLLLAQDLGVRRTMSLQLSPAAEYLGVFAIREPGQGGAIQVWGADLAR